MAPGMSCRVNHVVAGMPASGYIIFSSHVPFSHFDSLATEEQEVLRMRPWTNSCEDPPSVR